MPKYLKHSQVATKQASSTSQMYEAMSRIEMGNPKTSQSDSYTSKRSKSFRNRWSHNIPTQLHSECFWKHSLRVIKPNKALHCIQRIIKLQVDPLRLTGRCLRSAHAASHTTKQYWSYWCLMQTPSHSPVSPLKAQWKSGRSNAKLHPQGSKLPQKMSKLEEVSWNAGFSAPTCLVSSLSFSCGVAVSMREAPHSTFCTLHSTPPHFRFHTLHFILHTFTLCTLLWKT